MRAAYAPASLDGSTDAPPLGRDSAPFSDLHLQLGRVYTRFPHARCALGVFSSFERRGERVKDPLVRALACSVGQHSQLC